LFLLICASLSRKKNVCKKAQFSKGIFWRSFVERKTKETFCFAKARSKRCSIHAPNLTDELSTAEERRLNQFGSAG